MTARVTGKKLTTSSVNSKFKKGSKDFETKDAETTLKMLIRQAHEIHKGFSKRNQSIRKSQSFVDLKTDKTKTPQEIHQISDGKGDANPTSETVPSKIKKKKLKPNAKSVEKISRPPKPVKKLRKPAKEETKIVIRKTSSASSVEQDKTKMKPCDSSENLVQRFVDKNENSQKNVKILFEKEAKIEMKVLSPEEILTNIEKIWADDKNEVGDNYSKTNARFIETLVSLGQKVLNIKPETEKEEKVKVLKKFSVNSENGNNSSVLAWESISGDIKDLWGEKTEIPEEKMDQEMKSYRELKKLVNDELLRIWKPHEKVQVKEKDLEKVEEAKEEKEGEIKPGRIIVKPNPTSYLEKRALSTKTNYTSLIRKLDSEEKEVKKQVKDWNVVKKLENAFETLGNINWDLEEEGKEEKFQPKVKEEEVTQFILQRMQNHRETIVNEITKTEKKINEKFSAGLSKVPKTKKSKTTPKKEKPLEIFFRRSLEDVASSNGLLAETEKECKELTRKIMDDFKSKKTEKRQLKKSFAPISRIPVKENKKESEDRIRYGGKKLDPIDKKIRQDLKSLGLVQHKKTRNMFREDRQKVEGEGKVKECSGWRKRKDRSRSISRSIGSEGGNDQTLTPASVNEESTLPGKLATDAKTLETNALLETKESHESRKPDSDDRLSALAQVLKVSSNVWNKNLEDPGGPSTSEKTEPIFVNLEEFRYRKGDPSFRHPGYPFYPPAPLSKTEEEALRRQRELQKILHLNENNFKYIMEEYLPSQTYEDRKVTNHRKSIIVDHNTSGERMDDNQTVLGHASKLIVKEDPEEKKTAKVQYYGKGIRRVSEPVYTESRIREEVKRSYVRKSMYDEPGLDIRRTESKDVECQTDSNGDDSGDESDLFSIDEQ